MSMAPMTPERLAAIEEAARFVGDYSVQAMLLNLVVEVRRLQADVAEWRQHHDDACQRGDAAYESGGLMEREACARVADKWVEDWRKAAGKARESHDVDAEQQCCTSSNACRHVADEIRARGDKDLPKDGILSPSNPDPTAGMGPATKHGEADPEPVGKPAGDNWKHPPPPAAATVWNPSAWVDTDGTEHWAVVDGEPGEPQPVAMVPRGEKTARLICAQRHAIREALRQLDFMVPDVNAVRRTLEEVLG